MEWYVLQVMTGCEADVAQQMEQNGYKVILPYVPIFLKQGWARGGNLVLIKRPMLPGYVLVKADLSDLYRIMQIHRLKRLQKKIVRICGNGSSPVSLDKNEIFFFRACQKFMRPLQLVPNQCFQGAVNRETFQIVNAPPWAKNIYIKWYDQDRFKAKVAILSGSMFRERLFNVAAYNLHYNGAFADQLMNLYTQSLNESSHGQFEAESG